MSKPFVLSAPRWGTHGGQLRGALPIFHDERRACEAGAGNRHKGGAAQGTGAMSVGVRCGYLPDFGGHCEDVGTSSRNFTASNEVAEFFNRISPERTLIANLIKTAPSPMLSPRMARTSPGVYRMSCCGYFELSSHPSSSPCRSGHFRRVFRDRLGGYPETRLRTIFLHLA